MSGSHAATATAPGTSPLEPVEITYERRRFIDLQTRFRNEVLKLDRVAAAEKEKNKEKRKEKEKGGRKIRRQLNRHDYWAANNLAQHKLYKFDLVGVVPGAEVGDTFSCRSELSLTGVHVHHVHELGVVHVNLHGDDYPVAAAALINRREGICNNRDNGEWVVYWIKGTHAEEDGMPRLTRKEKVLEREKLALENSMKFKLPVRVIRGYYGPEYGRFESLYSYDGLYMVRSIVYELGNNVYNFLMERVKNQPPINIPRAGTVLVPKPSIE